MPKKTNGTRSNLVHCDNCDEEYSATYKRCPFCGARPDRSAYTQATNRFDLNDRSSSGSRAPDDSSSRRSSSRPEPQDEDEYVFDGSGVFDDDEDDDDEGGYAGRRGGKRLADDGFILTPTAIAGIIFSLVVIIAAILIVVNWVIPMVREGSLPTQTNQPNGSLPGTSPSPSISEPVHTDDPDSTVSPSVSPSVEPTASPSPAVSDGQPSSFTLTYLGKVKTDFTISDSYPDPVRLLVKFTPEGTTSTVTWTSSNPDVATVSANGTVTGVKKGTATITATLENGLTQTCKVDVRLSGNAASSPAPSSSSPPPSASGEPSPSPSASTPASSSLALSGANDYTISNRWPDPIQLRVTGASGDVTWTSSDTAVATVDSNGKVTRVGKGQCKITATDASGQTVSCTVRCESIQN